VAMGLKEKGADGEKGGDGVGPSGGGGAHDDDDHGGETAHRSKDGDEVSCWPAREIVLNHVMLRGDAILSGS